MLRILSIILLITANSATAVELDNMRIIGKGQLHWLFWPVYDAELLSAESEYDASEPFALKLTYKMKFTGQEIADRSAAEMRAQKVADEVQLAKWHAQMEEIFPDVKEGDSITGISTAHKHTLFIYNGKQAGVIKDQEFTRVFFDIWLSKKTSEPELRKKLLAEI